MYIFHIVNSGLYFEENQTGILIDGLHQGKQEGFSDTPLHIKNDIMKIQGVFRNMKIAAFTHGHPDHLSRSFLHTFREKNPDISVIIPGMMQTEEKTHINGIDIYQIRTAHMGQYKNIPHCSYLLEDKRSGYFVAGDGIFDENTITEVVKKGRKHMKALFLNFYHLTDIKTLKFISAIKPEKIFIIHLPFEKDDRYLLKKQAISILKRTAVKAEILHPMSEIFS